ncbi:MAG: 4-hydroxy-tetrahydrodipicolinate reductase [Clostridia bacterium]|nr:4-hydroxy-tetrahydrodipicolinate reductase [Clostridia bacterium]
MKVILCGALGKMGAEVLKQIEAADDFDLAAGVDPSADGTDARIQKSLGGCKCGADVIIDFSHHSATRELTDFAARKKLPLVVATTGQTEEELEMIVAASKFIPVFLSANMSVGVAILADFARCAAALMPDADIEIIEKHHSEKLDAPSGTALMIAKEIKKSRRDAEFNLGRSGHGKREKNEIGIHAVRLGGVIGEHEVILDNGVEAITLSHSAHSRSLFAKGALTAARFVTEQPAGLYDMYSMIEKSRGGAEK